MKSLLLMFCCVWAAVATAQPAQTGLTLSQAVDAAWAISVQKSASSGQVGAARASQVAAQSPWAAPPAVELGYRGDPLSSVAGRRETEVGLAWPLLLPGQRSAREASANAGLYAAQAGERAAKLHVAGEVREASWQVLSRTAELAVATAQAGSLRALAGDVDRRVAAGDLARSDALASHAERLAAESENADAEQRLRSARSAWHVLTGTDSVPEAAEAEARAMAEDHPQLLHSRLRVEAARERLELVRATRRDPPELMVRYRNEIAAAGAGSQSSVGLAMRLPLGTEDRNLPREAAALAELDLARTEERRLRAQLQAGFEVARAATAAAMGQLAMAESRVTLLRERARLIELSFRAGETALPELLRTLAAAALAESSLARQRAELGLARAKAQQAAGVLP